MSRGGSTAPRPIAVSSSRVCSSCSGLACRNVVGVPDIFSGEPSVRSIPFGGVGQVDDHLPGNVLGLRERLLDGVDRPDGHTGLGESRGPVRPGHGADEDDVHEVATRGREPPVGNDAWDGPTRSGGGRRRWRTSSAPHPSATTSARPAARRRVLAEPGRLPRRQRREDPDHDPHPGPEVGAGDPEARRRPVGRPGGGMS